MLFNIVLLITLWLLAKPVVATEVPVANQASWWPVQSIDTMKYSRDASREALSNPTKFSQTIENQISEIANTGATHVGIATPYDAEFLPVLKMWVEAARRHNLNVWFRGNWSGWEGWFEYSKITRQQHLEKTQTFLQTNPDLFRDGDIFTPCPECENGGPGDPRRTGDVTGFRKFLIDEYVVTKTEFQRMNKIVASNYASMNGDVARLIMNPETTQALDGVVTIDHYLKSPTQIAKDVKAIATKSQGKVVLGEIGMPIPDLHGKVTPEQQAAWIDTALADLASTPELIGVNYWVSHGGSTELWGKNNQPHLGVETLAKYYRPQLITGLITNSRHQPIANAQIESTSKHAITDAQGIFRLPTLTATTEISIQAEGYELATLTAEPTTKVLFQLQPIIPPICEKISPIRRLCEIATEIRLQNNQTNN